MSGYENFKQNSLEQLLINTTNEEVHHAFQRHTYEYEQELYQREGLTYPRFSYKTNKKIVDLLMQVSRSIEPERFAWRQNQAFCLCC